MKILPFDRSEAQRLLQEAVALHQKGQRVEAKKVYERLLASEYFQFDVLHLLGVIEIQSGNSKIAVDYIQRAICIDPQSASAYSNLGLALQQSAQISEALICYKKAIELKPDFAEAHYNLGLALQDMKLPKEAISSYDKAISIQKNYAEAFYNRGIAFNGMKDYENALISYERAISIKNNYAEAYLNQGITLIEIKKFEESIASFNKAISYRNDYAEAYSNRGLAFQKLIHHDQALINYEKAIAIKSDYAEALNNRGNALQELKNYEEAINSYKKAISCWPNFTEAYYNLAIALKDLGHLSEALACFDRVIAINFNYCEAHFNKGNTLLELRRIDEALDSYDKALQLDPAFEFLLGKRLHTQMHMCDWRGFSQQLDTIVLSIENNLKASAPFPLLGLLDNPKLHFKSSELYSNSINITRNFLPLKNKSLESKKIRVGYFSADFHNHATTYLMAELLESHDKSQFEIFGFSLNSIKFDEMQSRVSSAFDQFIDVSRKTDLEVLQISRTLSIDIAIDLKGYTQNSRPRIFVNQCAPIQVNFLGYPGSLGASHYDYIIADKTVIPETSQRFYSEKIIYLPHSYQPNDSKREISTFSYTRKDFGLPEGSFVFCCFNNNFKILPATFDSWMRILTAVDASVLWLLEDNSIAVKNLRIEAEKRGVNPNRLIFAKRLKLKEHLARHRLADLFLDTFPYNAHTTTSDALWSGLPVLTLSGISFVSRVAASLLTAIDLPELIADSPSEFESKAIMLASNRSKLDELSHRLQIKLLTSNLFKGNVFALHLEWAYKAIYRQFKDGELPKNFEVPLIE